MRIVTGAIGIGELLGRHATKLLRAAPGLVWFFRQKREFDRLLGQSEDRSFATGRLEPHLMDRYYAGGSASGYHFQQNLLVAQLIHAACPERHVDVGSMVEQFVGHVAVFCPVEVIDIRPMKTTAHNITFRQANIIEAGPSLENTCDSLSCLDALECFGLGRYGDPLDPDAHLKGFAALARMVRPGGTFYFAVPISQNQRIEFNAHRLFALPYLLDLIDTHGLDVASFHYVDDAGDIRSFVDHTSPAAKATFDLHFGCGIFVLKRR